MCSLRFTPDESLLADSAYYEWVRHGFELYAALDEARLESVECFPTASFTRWAGRRGSRTRAAWSADALVARGLADLPDRLSQDGRDAIAAALTARGSVERFGEIVVPLA